MRKAITLRLDEERAAMLEMVARADGATVTDTMRSAIDQLIERRRADTAFQERLARINREHRETLERLGR